MYIWHTVMHGVSDLQIASIPSKRRGLRGLGERLARDPERAEQREGLRLARDDVLQERARVQPQAAGRVVGELACGVV